MSQDPNEVDTEERIDGGDTLRWARVDIRRIEDLQDAVYEAGLEAVQLSRAPLSGSLAFARRNGVVFSAGRIEGRVALRGSLSPDHVTFGLGVRIAGGSKHWLKDVVTGSVGMWLPGDDHDAMYTPGSVYLAATLSMEGVAERAAGAGLVLDRKSLGGTGFHKRLFPAELVSWLQDPMDRVHSSHDGTADSYGPLFDAALGRMLAHFGRPPRTVLGPGAARGHSRIVNDARAYIEEHLTEPIALADVARAAHTTTRTLQRAFNSVLDETPALFVRKLRLHRLRTGLTSEDELRCSVSRVALRAGLGHPGRTAAWYREIFGENPSETLARRRRGERQRRVAEVARARILTSRAPNLSVSG